MAHLMGDPTRAGLGVTYNPVDFFQQPAAPRLFFKFPKVVADQKGKFEKDDLFRKLSRESEVKYTSHADRPLEERQTHFMSGCRRGHTEISFVTTGTSLQLHFTQEPQNCNFDKEPGKVHIKSHLIMNGVCVIWRGSINTQTLDGIGCLEYDEERAEEEAAKLKNMPTPGMAPNYQFNYHHLLQQQHIHRLLS